MLDLIFGFLVKSCVYSRLETSGTPQFGQTNAKFSFEQVFGLACSVGYNLMLPYITLNTYAQTLILDKSVFVIFYLFVGHSSKYLRPF